ncbi:MAG TPA: carboxypeptidase-like regulatory domain-containing protein [Terriglobia bacterium]|nr:carboxypeptidase-like regulatory domain-containing protein [Terriglobia bacterium]
MSATGRTVVSPLQCGIRTLWIAAVALLIPIGAAVSQTRGVSVSGIVIEMGTSQPLPRATVELQGNGVRLPALTDGAGQFVFASVPPGRYSLTASLNGFLHAEYGRRLPALSGANARGAIARGLRGAGVASATGLLNVTADRAVSGIRLAMVPAAAISGHIFNDKGQPYPYVRVEALRLSYPDGETSSALVSAVFSNDLGEYRLFGLPAGSYLIRADAQMAQQVYTPVTASTTPPLPGGLVIQTASGSIGYRGDPANPNNPLGGRGAAGRGAATTKENISSIVPVFYRNSTNDRDAARIDARPGDDLGGIDIAVAPVTLVPVSISATGAANAGFTIWPGAGAGARGGRGAAAAQLPPGSYVVSATTGGAGPRGQQQGQTGRLFGYAPLEVSSFGPPASVSVALSPGLSVSGQIVIDGVPASAADVARLSIRFRRRPSIPGVPDPPAVAPDLEGFFSAEGFIDGDYGVEVTGLQGTLAGAYVRSIRFAGADGLHDGVRVVEQPRGKIEVVIGPGAGQLEGLAKSSNGEPVAEATVALVPENRNRRDLYQSGVSDAAGRFHFDGVAPGTYEVFAWEEEVVPGSWFAADFMRSSSGRGTPVTVGVNGRGAVEARVIPIR